MRNAVVLPEDMDRECVRLCEEINRIPGLETVESCCGHGKEFYRIWFKVKDVKGLERLLEPVQACPSCNPLGYSGWVVVADYNEGGGVMFELRGPVGRYDQAEDISKFLEERAS